jgi:hypothetical protein
VFVAREEGDRFRQPHPKHDQPGNQDEGHVNTLVSPEGPACKERYRQIRGSLPDLARSRPSKGKRNREHHRFRTGAAPRHRHFC